METVNSEASLENVTIQIQNSEDLKKLDLTEFSSRQIFSYNCTNCGSYYEKKLSRLRFTNFELLCNICSMKKHRKPLTEEQKKIALEKRKQTNLAKYGVDNPRKSEKIKEKIRQTNLAKYGVENVSQSRRIKEKRKQTNLSRYGTECTWKSEKVKAKVKQTNLEKYGVENPLQSEEIRERIKQTNLQRYKVENPLQSEKIQEKRKQTYLTRYGVEHPWKSEEIQEKRKQTNLEKYGVEYPAQSEKIQAKVKQTNLEKYGVENPFQSAEIREKGKQTNLSRYGAEYYVQSKEMQSKRKQVYRYDSVNFDSKPELAFYIYCKDHGTEIERNNQKFFTYEFKGKTRRYFPDFVVEGELVEIKGDQFLKEDSTWQNPYSQAQSPQYEAKHQCALKNNVRILYSEDYQKCLDYVLEKYGKGFFEKCKG